MKNTLKYLNTLQKNINHWNHLYAVGQVDWETCEYIIKALRAQFWSNDMAREVQKDADESWEKTFGKQREEVRMYA